MRIPYLVAVALIAVGAMPALAGLSEVDQRARIMLEVAKDEERIRNAGVLLDDPALNAYLQQVVERLFPDRKGELHVRSILDSDFNAFAMPSGSVYFNTGALLRIEDEAQLASILGHEGTHYTADHAFREAVHVKHTAGTVILSPLIGGSIWGGYFWADHPAVKERVATFRALEAGRPPGAERNRERYLAITAHARMDALAVIHRRHDADLLVFLLDDE